MIAMDLNPKLSAMIEEAVAEANAALRKKRIRTAEEGVAFIQRYLKIHAPREVIEFQEKERRRLMVN